MAKMDGAPWVFPRCTVTGEYDGDTIYFDINQGFGTHQTDLRCRVTGPADKGFNAPELRVLDPAGEQAEEFAVSLLPNGTVCTVTSYEWDKYGQRYDASITLPDGRDFATVMVENGHGVWKSYS
jgi:endonuclease YncB( thermonuclease family)